MRRDAVAAGKGISAPKAGLSGGFREREGGGQRDEGGREAARRMQRGQGREAGHRNSGFQADSAEIGFMGQMPEGRRDAGCTGDSTVVGCVVRTCLQRKPWGYRGQKCCSLRAIGAAAAAAAARRGSLPPQAAAAAACVRLPRGRRGAGQGSQRAPGSRPSPPCRPGREWPAGAAPPRTEPPEAQRSGAGTTTTSVSTVESTLQGPTQHPSSSSVSPHPVTCPCPPPPPLQLPSTPRQRHRRRSSAVRMRHKGVAVQGQTPLPPQTPPALCS